MLPKPLIDISSNDPFHVGDHIKSYAGYHSCNAASSNVDSQLAGLLNTKGVSAANPNTGRPLTNPQSNLAGDSAMYDQVPTETIDSRIISKTGSDASLPPPLPPRDYNKDPSPELVSQSV